MAILVKICGLTNAEDARCALDAGADCLGFVLAARSPRRLDPAQLQTLRAQLPESVCAVGVFVNANADTVCRTAATCRLQIAQLHGDETAETAETLRRHGLRVWKAWTLNTPTDVDAAARFPADAILVDSGTPRVRGGTGRPANWELAAALARRCPVILAGGLSPDNVAAAVTRVQPAGIDVSSGVESAPRRKSHARVRRFLTAARAAAPASTPGEQS